MTLEEHLAAGNPVTATILAIAQAGREIASVLATGPLTPELAEHRGEGHGDVQKELDLRTDRIVLQALRSAPVAWVVSEEQDAPVLLNAALLTSGDGVNVAVDPLDGSSNIETNAPMGTIFSILPAGPSFALLPGRSQLAAGFLIYGAHTALVLTVGEGTHVFILDRDGRYVAAETPARIPTTAVEYAVNGSNRRHWDSPVRRFVDECVHGVSGPAGRDFNTRWLASLVAEAYRILGRGGVYLYPGDARPGYREGRLRAGLRGQPRGLAGGAGRRVCDRRPSPDPGHPAGVDPPAHPAGVRRGRGRGPHRRLPREPRDGAA